MSDDDAIRARAANCAHQPRPIGVVAEYKAFVVAAAPTRTAQLHPAAGKGVAEVAKSFDPWPHSSARWAQNQSAFEVRWVSHLANQPCCRQVNTRIAIRGIQRLNRTVHNDRRNRSIHPAQNTLCLAKAVAHQHASPARRRVGCPPRVDLGKHFSIRSPAVNGQAKG